MADKILKGEEGLLLAEGCKIHKEIKAKEKRLDEIKKALNLKDGQYVNTAGDSLRIDKETKWSLIDPETLFQKFAKKGRTKDFWKCVKVGITELGKYMPESVYNKMRSELDPSTKWFWNK